jgi:cytochrome c oxidase cbb3-type subunit III
MRINGLAAATLAALALASAARVTGQGTPATPPRSAAPFPDRPRPPGDPVVIERGKTLYGVNCRGCHGADLRGGDLGGPNILRSQLLRSDEDGELIMPIIQGSRQSAGMPAIAMSVPDMKAVAAYMRSVTAAVGRQGTPPSIGVEAPSILVGDANAGQAYFAAKCGNCHSPTGDLRGIATRIADPKTLQNTWVAGGRTGRNVPVSDAPSRRTATVVVTMPSGEIVEGRIVRIDDFLVTVGLADGSLRTIRRDGDIPKVDVRDPMKTHRDLLLVYTDKDIHDVTAYLVTLK